MKRQLSVLVLLAMLLAMLCPALAEETSKTEYLHVTDDEMLGVWQSKGNEDLEMVILPGSYAPLPNRSKLPLMYVEASWQENDGLHVAYYIPLERRKQKQQQGGFLDTLLGHTMANAIKTIEGIVDNQGIAEDIDVFDYTNETIAAIWTTEGFDDYDQPVTQNASGSIFAVRDENGKPVLYWIDDYDPHAASVELRRVMDEAPSADGLTQGVLRPVADMAADAQAKTALALIQWASDNKCLRVDAAALAENLRAAFAALTPADAQAFKDNYAGIKDMVLNAMSLKPETWADPARYKPFEDAGLKDAISKYSKTSANQRSVELLNAAIEGVVG